MASDRTVYRVQPERGQWKLSRDEAKVQHFENKADAVAEGRKRARAEQPSQLVVHDHHGKIEGESTYLNDPFPPRG
ncbi:DUF2188 domain-containing protein [Actinopolymorpha pittospori]|uniref:DUF2188 domain-containing protein n=1 Tax=Actinopolymorpha pittospori TaxID=648752 RepID=A0A927REA6_9ACTN|nr:DUF2188 domain-containing protein [Actinopolymorpha pittospori]MBE1608985.1 hypothetical protein [Actinopolymorpha pittospori]